MHMYRALVAEKYDMEDPLSGLGVVERTGADAQRDWVPVRVRAAAVNHHDLWTLRGVQSHPIDPPAPLGTDAAGTSVDGADVVVHAVVGTGEQQRLLSEGVNGALADCVWVPAANLIPKPEFLSWEEASCLPTTWLTAWHMVVTAAKATAGEVLLVQGATGGLATAAIQLGVGLGMRVIATSRSDTGLAWATELGAEAAPSGERLGVKADVIVDGVGAATAEHSQRSLAFGGRWVVAGVTTGGKVQVDLSRWFWRQLQLIGVTMGSRDELGQVIAFMAQSGVRPRIGSVHTGLDDARGAFDAMLSGATPGKHVVRLA